MAYAPVIAHVNAQLLEVAGGGFSADYDQGEGADPAKWSGELGAYLGEELSTKTRGDDEVAVESSRIWVPLLELAATVQRGDSITYRHAGTELTRKVRAIRAFEAVGVLRLELQTGA
jgi:hypothetical protein